METKPKPRIGIFFSGAMLLWFAVILISCQAATVSSGPLPSLPSPFPSLIPSMSPSPFSSPSPSPQSTLNLSRLDEPPLPPNPTQLEKGRHLFWLNCMTCHGDRGQGLTDEFRSLYVEEADCWVRGCHAGHNSDQGFPIPHTIPAIISSTGELPPFKTPEQLFEYLRTTHPPQNPGFMPAEDYWALTAYLLAENGRLPVGVLPGP
jgi:hypothetical protein